MANRDCASISQMEGKRLEPDGITKVANLINLHADMFTSVPLLRQAARHAFSQVLQTEVAKLRLMRCTQLCSGESGAGKTGKIFASPPLREFIICRGLECLKKSQRDFVIQSSVATTTCRAEIRCRREEGLR